MGRPRTPKGRARETAARLAAAYPDAACALNFDTAWQLLVATILSAQCTDERVNMVTPVLFAKYPEPEDVLAAPDADVEEVIRPTGFFRNKTRSIKGAAAAVVECFGGEVPDKMEELVTIPGVGRKTANVILWVAYGKPGIAVDTHVQRLSRRLGLTTETDPVKIEFDLYAALPRREWGPFGLRLILHGRRICTARKPACADCVLGDFCPKVGV
jgi:endonuclease-3